MPNHSNQQHYSSYNIGGGYFSSSDEQENNYGGQELYHTRTMIPIIFNNNQQHHQEEVFGTTFLQESSYHIIDSATSLEDDGTIIPILDVEEQDLSPEEQQRCPSMLIYLKPSNSKKRKILQDITWDLYSYRGLMMHIGKLFPQDEQEQVKVSYLIGHHHQKSSPKIAIQNEEDWQRALQQLLLSDETILKLFIKSGSNNKKKNHDDSTLVKQKKKKHLLKTIVHKQEEFKIKRHFKRDNLTPIMMDTSSVRNVYIDAGSILLHVRDLKTLAFNSDKYIAEKTLLQLAKSLHHQNQSFDHIHVFFNSTMNIQPEENEAGTFVVSIAEPFSTSGDLMVEFLNRQIIAGALESCLVVSYDRVLLRELNNMLGVKICNARSWFKICQQQQQQSNGVLANSKDWLKNIISEITY